MKQNEIDREQINRQVAEFLSAGGVIDHVPTGVGGEKRLRGVPRAAFNSSTRKTQTQKQVRDKLKKIAVVPGAF